MCVCLQQFLFSGPWATFIGLATNFYCPVLVLVCGAAYGADFLPQPLALSSYLSLCLSLCLASPSVTFCVAHFLGDKVFAACTADRQTDCGSNHIAKRLMAATFGLRDAFLPKTLSVSL